MRFSARDDDHLRPTADADGGAQFHTNVLLCRSCGQRQDSVTSMTGQRAPRTGDFTVCVYCGAVSEVIVGPLGIGHRTPDPEALAAFMATYGEAVTERLAAYAQRRRDRLALLGRPPLVDTRPPDRTDPR